MRPAFPPFALFPFPCPKCGCEGKDGDASMQYRGDYNDLDYAGSRSIEECIIHRCPRCGYGEATQPIDRKPDRVEQLLAWVERKGRWGARDIEWLVGALRAANRVRPLDTLKEPPE